MDKEQEVLQQRAKALAQPLQAHEHAENDLEILVFC